MNEVENCMQDVYGVTQEIDITTMDTLPMEAIKLDETIKTPVPALPEEIAGGPVWQLFKHGAGYALVLYSINGAIEIPLESGQLLILGIDIHFRYRKLEEG